MKSPGCTGSASSVFRAWCLGCRLLSAIAPPVHLVWFALCVIRRLTDSDGGTDFSGCGFEDVNGTQYAYYYPNEDTTQYLYETFPEVSRSMVLLLWYIGVL